MPIKRRDPTMEPKMDAPVVSREDDSREPMRNMMRDPTRRRRSMLESDDKFYIPMDEIPEGLSYEWKRWSCKGEEDPFYIAQMMRQEWEPVKAADHPNWVPPGYKDENIIKSGMILMRRTMEATLEARAELEQASRSMIRQQEARLGRAPAGTLPRDFNNGRLDSRPQIVKEIGRMVADE